MSWMENLRKVYYLGEHKSRWVLENLKNVLKGLPNEHGFIFV